MNVWMQKTQMLIATIIIWQSVPRRPYFTSFISRIVPKSPDVLVIFLYFQSFKIASSPHHCRFFHNRRYPIRLISLRLLPPCFVQLRQWQKMPLVRALETAGQLIGRGMQEPTFLSNRNHRGDLCHHHHHHHHHPRRRHHHHHYHDHDHFKNHPYDHVTFMYYQYCHRKLLSHQLPQGVIQDFPNILFSSYYQPTRGNGWYTCTCEYFNNSMFISWLSRSWWNILQAKVWHRLLQVLWGGTYAWDGTWILFYGWHIRVFRGWVRGILVHMDAVFGWHTVVFYEMVWYGWMGGIVMVVVRCMAWLSEAGHATKAPTMLGALCYSGLYLYFLQATCKGQRVPDETPVLPKHEQSPMLLNCTREGGAQGWGQGSSRTYISVRGWRGSHLYKI